MTFGPALIDGTTYFKDVYYDEDLSTGNDDGTNEANAWKTIGSMIAGVDGISGLRVNMKKAASPVIISTDAIFPVGGTSASMSVTWYRGYGTDIGDGTKWIGQTATTFEFRSIAGTQIFQDLSFVGDNSATSAFENVSSGATFIRCAFSNTGQGQATNNNESVCIACTMTNTGTFSSSGYEACTPSSGTMLNCKCQSDGLVMDFRQTDEGDVTFCIGNVAISDSLGARIGIEFGGSQVESAAMIVAENSVWGALVGLHYQDYPSAKEYGAAVCYNIAAGCVEGIEMLDTANQEQSHILNNAFGDNSGADIGSSINADVATMIISLTLSGLPYATTTALDLDSTAGEGAACRSAGILGYIDGTGTDLVTGAFSYGAHREGSDDSGSADTLVGSSQSSGGGIQVDGKDFGMWPLNKTSEIG